MGARGGEKGAKNGCRRKIFALFLKFMEKSGGKWGNMFIFAAVMVFKCTDGPQ